MRDIRLRRYAFVSMNGGYFYGFRLDAELVCLLYFVELVVTTNTTEAFK